MNEERIMVWADGYWCYASVLEATLTWMSNDYRVIPAGVINTDGDEEMAYEAIDNYIMAEDMKADQELLMKGGRG